MMDYPTFECAAIAGLFIEPEVVVTTRWERRGFVTTVVQVSGALRDRDALYAFAEHEHGVIEARINDVRYELFFVRPDITIDRGDNWSEVVYTNPTISLTTHARLERRIHPVVLYRRRKAEKELSHANDD